MRNAVLASLLCVLLTSQLRAQFILIDADEGTFPSVLSPNFMQGYDFVPQRDLALTAIGFWDEGQDGLPRSFEIGIWETDSQTLLRSVIIEDDPIDESLSASGGAWRFEELYFGVRLYAGTTYSLAFQVGPTTLVATDALLVDFADITTNPDISIEDNQRFLATDQFVFPTNSTPAGPSEPI